MNPDPMCITIDEEDRPAQPPCVLQAGARRMRSELDELCAEHKELRAEHKEIRAELARILRVLETMLPAEPAHKRARSAIIVKTEP